MEQPRTKRPITMAYLPLAGTKTIAEQGLTLIQPYFGEVKRFNFMYDNYWSVYPQHVKDKLHIILVDDCGTPPIHELMKGRTPDFNLTIYRIVDDLLFNTPGALNLGTVKATTDWVFHLDSDCAVEPDMMDKILNCTPLTNYEYKFKKNRITANAHNKAITRWLPCANLLHKDTFNLVGGFDEDFTGARSGGYGFFDCHFDHKIVATDGLYRACINGIIVTEYMETLVEDFKPVGPLGTGVFRTNRQNILNRRLYRHKCAGTIPNNPEILRFKYEKVFANERTVSVLEEMKEAQ